MTSLSFKAAALSGSLTRTTSGISTLVAGTSISIVSNSNGSVTITNTSAGATPGGSDKQIQFNSNDALGASSKLTFNPTGSASGLGILILSGILDIPVNGAGSTSFQSSGSIVSIGLNTTASNFGTFSQGYALNTSNIYANGLGSFAQGHANSNSSIFADGLGAFAHGRVATNSKIYAGAGGFAHGTVTANKSIEAIGTGSIAIGAATTQGITASADHSFQFGPGLNDLSSSFQIGIPTRSIRLSTSQGTKVGDIGTFFNSILRTGTANVTGSIQKISISGSTTTFHEKVEQFVVQEFSGDVVYFGAGTLIQGKIHYLDRTGSWQLANAATGTHESATSVLGYSFYSGDVTQTGILLKGFVNLSSGLSISGSFSTGSIVYLASASNADSVGKISSSFSSVTGSFVRSVGYFLSPGNLFHFDPDKTYIVV